MLEIGIFHNGASDLPCVRTKSGIVVNDGNLAEVHARFGDPTAQLEQVYREALGR